MPTEAAIDTDLPRLAYETHGPDEGLPVSLQHGGADGCGLPAVTANQASLFPGGYRRRARPGTGRFVPRGQPEAAINAILGT